jgi:hypothetical protein
MILSHSHRFLFFHIAKTGGMSVREALEPFCVEPEKFVMRRPSKMIGDRVNPLYKVWETLLLHAKASDAKRELPPEIFDPYFKFVFVRNPWDWLVSMYHFVLREPEAARHDEVKALGTFDAYVEWAVSTPNPFPKGVSGVQSEMITDADGNMLVDYVGAYENLAADFAEVLTILGLQASLPHVNQSVHREYQTYYNDRTRAIVAGHFQPDIELFGYSFGGSPRALLKGAMR